MTLIQLLTWLRDLRLLKSNIHLEVRTEFAGEIRLIAKYTPNTRQT